MKQNECNAAGSSKKIIVNDMLCFMQSNLCTLSQSSICRLCEETYMPEDISSSFQELKENVHILDPLFNVYPTNNSKRETLKAIIMLFNSKACDYLQFVSTTLNMPKMGSYQDMLSTSCLVDEVKELKQFVQQQTEILSTGLQQLSNNFKKFAKEHGNKSRSSTNDDETIVPGYDTFTSFLPSLNHFVEKNDSIFAEVNESHNNNEHEEESSTLQLPEDTEKDMLEVKDVVMVGRPSESLLPASMRRSQTTTTTNNNSKSIDVKSSIQMLTGKFHKKHSCKICGYAGNLTDVTRHMRTHTGERPFSCPFCSSRFSLRGNMIKHLARKHGTFLSRIPPSGKRHMPRKFAPKKLNSDEGNLTSEAILSLAQQNAVSTIGNDEKIEADESVLNASLPDLQTTKIEESEKFPTSSYSLNIEHNEDNLDDDTMISSTPFSNSSMINDISRASSAVATYNPMLHLQSNQGDDATASPMQVRDLFASNHSAKKKHRCDICGYTSTASDVTRHKRTHTGERPFPCPVCDARFSLRGNMTKHVARMHPDFTGNVMRDVPKQVHS